MVKMTNSKGQRNYWYSLQSFIPRDSNRAILACLAVILAGYDAGTLLGWELRLSYTSEKGINSVPLGCIGAIISTFYTSVLMDMKGRRIALLFLLIPLYLSLILHALSKYADQVLPVLMRIIGGLGLGSYYQIAVIYVAEIVHRSCRGVVCAVIGLTTAIGYVFAMNSYKYSIYLIINLSTGCLFYTLAIVYCKETPYHFMAIKHFDCCKRELRRFRREETQNRWQMELREIAMDVYGYPMDCTSFWSMFLSFTDLHAEFLHRVVLVLGVTLLSQSLFIFCVPEYHNTTGIVFVAYWVIMALSWGSHILFVHYFGRRALLIVSSIGVASCNLITIIVWAIHQDKTDKLLLLLQRLSMGFFFIGLHFIPMTLMSEVFPYNFRASATAFVVFFLFLSRAILPICSYSLYKYYDELVVLIFFLFIEIAAVFFSWFVTTETKQKSLCHVQIRMDSDYEELELK